MNLLNDVQVVTPTLPDFRRDDAGPRREVFVRSGFNYDMDLASEDSGLECEDQSRAIQSAKEEVDINTIVRRFGLTGQLPTDLSVPRYEDFEEILDYHTAMNRVVAAKDSFMQMPAEVRDRFRNDPGLFVDFVSDDRNAEEARKLGILGRGEVPVEKVVPDSPTRPAQPVGGSGAQPGHESGK